MSQEQIQWLLLAVSAAPVQTLQDVRNKAAWLEELAGQLEPKESEPEA